MEISPSRKILRFFVVTGAISLVLFGLVYMLEKAGIPTALLTAAQCLSAWGPTFAVLVLFRLLYPGRKFGEYFKETFSAPIKPLTLLMLLCVQVGILILSVVTYLWSTGQDIHSLTFVSLPEALLLLVTQLLSGASGEELGWRGFLLRDYEKRNSVFMSAIKVALVWGLWHIPVWFSLNYTGSDLICYIVFFLVEILAFSIIMAVFYQKQKNLLVPIWIHFLVNFSVGLVKIDLLKFMGWMALGYVLFAAILLLVERKWVFKANPVEGVIQ